VIQPSSEAIRIPAPGGVQGLDHVPQRLAERAEPGRLDGGDRRAGRSQCPDREPGIGPLVYDRHSPSLARREAAEASICSITQGPPGVALADGGLTVAGR
jgi:hypothetical protein